MQTAEPFSRADVPQRLGRPLPGQVVRLPDGRQLGFARHGDGGRPVFFFHGVGTSRLARHPDDSIAVSLGADVIAVDRPGIGLSDAKPGRRLLDWPDDVAALADLLGIDRFAILGWSGGGPYAAACAYKLRDRVIAAGIVSGPGPFVGPGAMTEIRATWRRRVRLAGMAPWLMRVAIWNWGRPLRRDPVRAFEMAVAEMCESDRLILADPGLRSVMIENAVEVYRQGGRGLYDEGRILAGPWGFRPDEIPGVVHLWHGELDSAVPPEMGRHMAHSIPRCHARFYPREGHHLLYSRWREILKALIA